jgi:hypothetical protein
VLAEKLSLLSLLQLLIDRLQTALGRSIATTNLLYCLVVAVAVSAAGGGMYWYRLEPMRFLSFRFCYGTVCRDE